MENQTSIQKTMLTYGIIIAVLVIIMELANYSFGNMYQPHWIITVLRYVFIIGGVMYAIKTFANASGSMNISQGIKLGLGIMLVFAIIKVVYLMVFMNVIEPNFLANSLEYTREVMYEKFPDMSEEQIETTLEASKTFTTPTSIALMSVVMNLLGGLILGLIGGAAFKKEEQF